MSKKLERKEVAITVQPPTKKRTLPLRKGNGKTQGRVTCEAPRIAIGKEVVGKYE